MSLFVTTNLIPVRLVEILHWNTNAYNEVRCLHTIESMITVMLILPFEILSKNPNL